MNLPRRLVAIGVAAVASVGMQRRERDRSDARQRDDDLSGLAKRSGHFVGAGESHRYTLQDTVWTARADVGVMEPRHIVISMRPIDNSFRWWWNLDLASPSGQPLKPGTYDNARRWPFQSSTQPGLSFSGTGRGCNTLTGSFVIREIVLGPDNTLDRLSASFEQHCEGSSAALRGDINIVANPWR